jgi:hypothetical protein
MACGRILNETLTDVTDKADPIPIPQEPSAESLAEIPEVTDWSKAERGKFFRGK